MVDSTRLMNKGELLRWREKKRQREGWEINMPSSLHIVLNLVGTLWRYFPPFYRQETED